MHFNPRALLVTALCLLFLVAALKGSAWGIAGVLALFVVQSLPWVGRIGKLTDIVRLLLGRPVRRV